MYLKYNKQHKAIDATWNYLINAILSKTGTTGTKFDWMPPD